MQETIQVIYIVLLSMCWLMFIAVLLPFIKNDYWIFKILEYPRYQKFIICLLLILALAVYPHESGRFYFITLIMLSLCLCILIYKIWPYTPLSKTEMKGLKGSNKDNQLKIFTANVFQDNRNYEKLLLQVRQTDPDIIFLVETDRGWQKAMDVLLNQYPHCLKEPLDNTYGMLFYSRLAFKGKIEYLVENDVPSLDVIVELPSSQKIRIWGLHPKPPVPGEDNRSTAKDKELMKVAFKAKKEKLPVVVFGDLNDVAWSYVTELFRKTSELLDPRRGRGFYSTFSADHWYMRFPLDYVFCSAHFELINMKRLQYNGSDHFPMFIQLEYNTSFEKQQEKPEADEEELGESAKIAKQHI